MQNFEAPDESKEFMLAPYHLLTMIKALLEEELIASYRLQRDALRIKLNNGQVFRVRVEGT